MDVASSLSSSHRSPPWLGGREGLRKMGLIVAPLFSLPPPLPIRGSRALRQTICCALPLPPQPRRTYVGDRFFISPQKRGERKSCKSPVEVSPVKSGWDAQKYPPRCCRRDLTPTEDVGKKLMEAT